MDVGRSQVIDHGFDPSLCVFGENLYLCTLGGRWEDTGGEGIFAVDETFHYRAVDEEMQFYGFLRVYLVMIFSEKVGNSRPKRGVGLIDNELVFFRIEVYPGVFCSVRIFVKRDAEGLLSRGFKS